MLRYAAGKADWMAFGLPVEGQVAHVPIAADVASVEVPTCGPGDRAGRLPRKELLVVVNERRVVLGAIDGEALAKAEPSATAEELMEPGPLTVRPDVPVEQIAEQYIGDRRYLLVTNSDGVLLGVIWRREVEAPAHRAGAAAGHGA